MGTFERYIKNINKQYGKNIKAFEDKELDPSKETLAFWNKIQEETGPTESNLGKKSLDLSTHKPMLSIMYTRWGLTNREDNRIGEYGDIEKIAKGEE